MSNQEIHPLIAELTEIVRPLVKAVEKSPEVTRNRYGDYMSAIALLAEALPGDKSPCVYIAIGAAMQRAGGNQRGIIDALRTMGYL